jgi:AcrR family transcriptional regulator
MGNLTHTPLSRDRVLDSAVRLADDQGLEALSMRKLAAALGVEAMSLYNHVPGKAALLSGMLERVLHELVIPSDPAMPWAERLRRGAISFLTVARSHPSLVQLLTSQHIHTGAALAPTEAVLGIFRQAGYTGRDAVHAYQTLIGYVLGFMLQQDKGTIGLSCCADDGGCAHSTTGLPHVDEALGDGRDLTSTAAFEFGLDLVLAGLQAKIESWPHSKG